MASDVAAHARVYCDESGFTGNNLLDTEQPYFAYAGVMAEEDVTGDFIQKTIRDFDIQGDELKGSRLLRYNKGRQAVNVVLERFASSARVAVHEKRFALSTYFFEYVFEPALSDQNSIFYRANFHRFVAALMYAHLVVQHEPAGKLITSFFDMMNSLDIAKFEPLNSQQIVSIDERSPLDQIALFAFLHRAAIAKELSVVYGDGHTPNWILDLSVTSLFSILSAVGQEHQTIEVFCDESKPLLVNREIFDKMVDRPDMPTRMHFWDNRPFGFNLSVEPKFVDSKTHPGIQIADVIAATANYCMQHRTEPHSQRWFGMLKESLSDCSILPDLDYADLQQRDGFVGAMILRELLDRSLRKADLFDGMPEFIACARESFPMWLQREFAQMDQLAQ
jgi:hypothetical protein